MTTSRTIRVCHNLTIMLAGFVLVAFALPIATGTLGFRMPIPEPLPAIGVLAACVLVVLCLVTANLGCSQCRKWYFLPGHVHKPLLRCNVPILRKPCCNCGHDAFRNRTDPITHPET